MSTFSKILVVLILVTSVVMCAMSIALFAQRANWKALYENTSKNSKATITQLEADKNELIKQKGDVQAEIERVKADNSNMTAEISRLKQEVADKDAEKARIETLAKQKDDAAQNLQEKVDNLVKEITALNEKMRRDSQELLETKRSYERVVNQLTTLRDKANSLMLQLKNTQRELTDAKSEVEKLNATLKKYAEVAKVNIVEVRPKEAIRARVMAVNNEAGIIMLSVGKDDQVTRGDEFILRRGPSYVCKVRVEATYPDSCFCRVLPESLVAADAKVEIGDAAFTE
jgi:septal ring factor EnvC (AmiA/AmiB activator)